MSDASLKFAKIVSTPTLNSWSQAYNAGGLFAVLSFTKDSSSTEDEPLGILGKTILESLEEEYFTLETKSLISIKEAISITSQKIPPNISSSLTVISIINNVLYGFVHGKGKIFIKRGEKLGLILSQVEEENSICSSSGFLENDDLIILETRQFASLISSQELNDSLDHKTPQDIAENLSPKMHEKEEGAAASIIVCYQKVADPLLSNSNADETIEAEIELQKENIPEEQEEEVKNKISILEKIRVLKEKIFARLPYLNKIQIKNTIKFGGINSSFSHSKKIFLTISFILLIVLASSIFFAIQKRESEKTQALFQEVFSQAEKKYKEGESLISLNQNLAKESLNEAERILQENKVKFNKDSNEAKQIDDLLAKTEAALNSSRGIYSVETKPAKQEDSLLLDSALQNLVLFLTQDDSNIYFVNDEGISSINKKTKKSSLIIKKAWKEAGGIGVYLGNIYLLDKQSNQILKFVGSGKDYTKANYFTTANAPELSKASSIAIDGSIWIVFSDGSVGKFTKGKADSLNISGLDNPLVSPSRIYTDTDLGRFYILDKGNERIVVFNKDGSYQAQYQSNVLKDAKEFEVLEKDKKIYILSQNKLWQIDIK